MLGYVVYELWKVLDFQAYGKGRHFIVLKPNLLICNIYNKKLLKKYLCDNINK